MNRLWKVACILFSIGFLVLAIGNCIRINENEAYYKQELMDYIVSANDIVIIIAQIDADEADYKKLYNDLLERLDRIEKFIYHSNKYLGFNFGTRVFSSISSDLYKHFDDGVISDDEIEYINTLNIKLTNFANGIGSENVDDEDYDVNLNLSIEDIHSYIRKLEYEFE